MDWGFLGGPNGSEIIHPLPPPPPQVLGESNLQNRISPSILLIVVILAVIFFISGLLHLLARCLLRSAERDPEDTGTATALQGQLQQLFLLHDGGVDQAFIDTLPVFVYKAIIGLKDPFDCAVCLCEFEPLDKLRLLPKCSHAFHLECIDTWLLSHSTCPLCRRSLLADFSPNCSPAVPVLESESESSREACLDIGETIGENDCRHDAQNIGGDASPSPGEKVVSIKLGKIKNVDVGACGGEGSSSCDRKLNERRCFSMGSFEYVMDEASLLQVPIKPMKKKPGIAKPGHRLAMSECDCSSRRHGIQEIDQYSGSSGRIDLHKRESFSISKIWLRTKKEKATTEGSSRRTASFRLPLKQEASIESMVKISGSNRTMASEFDVSGWLKTGSELGSDLEMGSCNNSIGSRVEEAAPSFARRTLLWIAGRQSRVVNHG